MGFHSAPLESIARIPLSGSVARNPCTIGTIAREVFPVPVPPVTKKWQHASSRVHVRPQSRRTIPSTFGVLAAQYASQPATPPAVHGNQEPTGRGRVRSEEHTSELQ